MTAAGPVDAAQNDVSRPPSRHHFSRRNFTMCKMNELFSQNGLSGCVAQRRHPGTGLLVGVYEAEQAQMCTAAGRWASVCEAHSTLANHRTLALARAHAEAPESWCETCRDVLAAKAKFADTGYVAPDQFPLLVAGNQERTVRVYDAVGVIASGQQSGSIRKVVLDDARQVLSNAVERAWSRHVSEPFFYAGKYEGQPRDVQELYNDLLVMGLHRVTSASKKISSCRIGGAAVDAMRAVIMEAMPLAEAVSSLKENAIKGRAPPSAPSKPVNPNKIVRTCGVCFRKIALAGATMALHGYKRPGSGGQTASCPGIRFRPLEVSSEGLEWLIDSLRRQLATSERALAAAPSLNTLSVPKHDKSGLKFEVITKGEPDWASAYRWHVWELESEIQSLKREVPRLETKLRDWKPTE
jgi:hypothetical protein